MSVIIVLNECLHNNDVIIKLAQLSYCSAMSRGMINQRKREYTVNNCCIVLDSYLLCTERQMQHEVMIPYEEECIINSIVNSKQL